MNLILAPARAENIQSSISAAVPRDFLEAHLSPNEVATITGFYGTEKPIHCWGMSKAKSSEAIFLRMQTGDIVLLSVSGTGKFDYAASITLTMKCPSRFGNALWPHTHKAPWTLVYFLTNLSSKTICKRALLKALGYKAEDRLQGRRVVPPGRLEKVLDPYVSIRDWLRSFDMSQLNKDEINERCS
jgi:hypothetical protein